MPCMPSGQTTVVRLGEGYVRLKVLRGVDEQAVTGTDLHQVCDLIDRLLDDAPGTCAGPGDALQLTVAERDRLLAAVYKESFGDHIAATAVCRHCEKPFDLDFSLSQLLEQTQPTPLKREIRLDDGTRLRVPTGADEQALLSQPSTLSAEALLNRCIEGETGDHRPIDVAQALERLEQAAPVLDLEVDAPCPECGGDNPVYFNIQEMLLGALLRERSRRLGEIHLLARAYGWRLGEILELTRVDRRALVDLLERERLGGSI